MKYSLILFIAFFICITQTTGQIKIDEAKIQLTLPNASWKFIKKDNLGDNRFLYSCKRAPITDNDGKKIIPNISIVTEPVPENTDLIEYSTQKQIEVPFKTIDVFSKSSGDKNLNMDYAIGYKGSYESNSIKHIIYVVHLINGKCGVQIIMDMTESVFNNYVNEFISTIRSIKKK